MKPWLSRDGEKLANIDEWVKLSNEVLALTMEDLMITAMRLKQQHSIGPCSFNQKKAFNRFQTLLLRLISDRKQSRDTLLTFLETVQKCKAEHVAMQRPIKEKKNLPLF